MIGSLCKQTSPILPISKQPMPMVILLTSVRIQERMVSVLCYVVCCVVTVTDIKFYGDDFCSDT
jgi:hypothetical protein